jgi:hypothetical protein
VLLWLRGTYRAYTDYQQQVLMQILAGAAREARVRFALLAVRRSVAAIAVDRTAGSGGGRGRRGGRGGASGPRGPAGPRGGAVGAARRDGRRRRGRRGGGGGAIATGGRRWRGWPRRPASRRRAGRAGAAGRPAAGPVAAGGAAAAAPAARRGTYVPPTTTRADTVINTGWKHLRMDNSGASAAAFDDASWASGDAAAHLERDRRPGRRQQLLPGIGWYRRHYTPPASAAGKRIFLQFDGANIVAVVYVNGTMVGTHRGGFSRFRFDVTAT